MSLRSILARHWTGDVGEPALLDFVPVSGERHDAHVRDYKLHRAAQRYGKPFKCTRDGLPRETMVRHIQPATPFAVVSMRPEVVR